MKNNHHKTRQENYAQNRKMKEFLPKYKDSHMNRKSHIFHHTFHTNGLNEKMRKRESAKKICEKNEREKKTRKKE